MIRRAILILTPAIVAACGGDSAGTNPMTSPLTVAFSAALTNPGHSVVTNGVQSWSCGFTFTAHATGGAVTDFVEWTDGEVDFRLSSTGAQSTLFLTGNDLQDWFGSSQLNTGVTETASRSLVWTGPFTATVFFRYFDAGLYSLPGASHTATLPVSC